MVRCGDCQKTIASNVNLKEARMVCAVCNTINFYHFKDLKVISHTTVKNEKVKGKGTELKTNKIKKGDEPVRKIYLAAPFFNKEQIETIERIENICRKNKLNFFSPRLECFCPPDASKAQKTKTFEINVEHIKNAEFIFARIDDFDPGTIWEMGCAFAHRVPTFAYTTVEGRGLNLMLAESGVTLVRCWEDIEKFLAGDLSVAQSWEGEIE